MGEPRIPFHSLQATRAIAPCHLDQVQIFRAASDVAWMKRSVIRDQLRTRLRSIPATLKCFERFERLEQPSEPQRTAALSRIGAADESEGSRVDDDCVSAAKALRIPADNLVAAAPQFIFHSGNNLRLQTDFRTFDVIESRRGDRFLWRHAEID